MTPRELLRTCAERYLTLSVSASGDKLVVAPADAVDQELRARLLAAKPALLQILAGPRLEDGLPAEHCAACGSPSWWTSNERPGWHCAYCDARPDPFRQGRIVIVAAGAWGRH